jgi:tRNA (adenine37-N6)-methyltransferase
MNELHGRIATHAPSRPNPIGISSVRLLEVCRNVLREEALTTLDNTTLPDINPCTPALYAFQATRIGWCAAPKSSPIVADGRFEADSGH